MHRLAGDPRAVVAFLRRQEAWLEAVAAGVVVDGLPEQLLDGGRAEGDLQKVTDSFVAEIDAALKDKEAEIMEV